MGTNSPSARGPSRRRRLRIVGAAILAAGLTGAWYTDWVQTRTTQPGLEELMPGSAAGDERRMRLLYGRGVTMAMGWEDDLRDPAVQAVLIALASAVAAGVCLHVARIAHEGDESGQ